MPDSNPSFPYVLESSSNTLIIALSPTEIGKVMLPNNLQFVDANTGKPVDFLNEQPTFEDEVAALIYANAINDLMPKFIRKDRWQTTDGKEHDMLVMERLYPLPIHHFDRAIRTEMMMQFAAKLKELHENRFVHGDLMRPTNFYTRGNQEWMFKNIVQTKEGLRLIDAGFGKVLTRDNIKLFVHTELRERAEVDYFREYYLG
jgi:hypothetical protein